MRMKNGIKEIQMTIYKIKNKMKCILKRVKINMRLKIGISTNQNKTLYLWIIILKWYQTWKLIKFLTKHREDLMKITINKQNHLNQELKKIKRGKNMHLVHQEELAIIISMELKKNRNNRLPVRILHKKVMIKVKF